MSVNSVAKFYCGLVVALKRARESQNRQEIVYHAGRHIQELTASKCAYEADPKELMVGLRCMTELQGYRFSLGQCKLLKSAISRLNIDSLSVKEAVIVMLFRKHLRQRISYLSSVDPVARINPFIEEINKSQNKSRQIYLTVSAIREILAWMEIHDDSLVLKEVLTQCLDVLNAIGLSLSPGEYDVVYSAIAKMDDPTPYLHLIGIS